NLSAISQSAPMIAGCTTPVTFSTGIDLSGMDSYDPGTGNYTINWTLPAGWAFNGPSTGSSVSVIPGATAGVLHATLTMSACSYPPPTRKGALDFFTPAPVFTSTPSAVCATNSTTTFSVSPICGASSYTYTIQTFNNIAGINFAGNGQRTITSSSSSV